MEKAVPGGKNMHKGQHNNKHRRQKPGQHKNKRPRLAPEGVKKRTTTAPHSSASSLSRRMDDIRLILESSPSDDELTEKVDAVQDELRAVDQALDDEGTYLGIVDKGELEKRKQLLERRSSLLDDEQKLMQTLRVQLAEEEQAAAERAELRLPCSPASRHDGSSKNDNTPTAAAEQSSPSTRIPATAAATASSPSPAKRTNTYHLSPPSGGGKGGGGSIGDFLKKSSAAMGKKLAGGAGVSSSSTGSRITPLRMSDLDVAAAAKDGSGGGDGDDHE